jgi:uncharacterized protein (UPF0297 family)
MTVINASNTGERNETPQTNPMKRKLDEFERDSIIRVDGFGLTGKDVAVDVQCQVLQTLFRSIQSLSYEKQKQLYSKVYKYVVSNDPVIVAKRAEIGDEAAKREWDKVCRSIVYATVLRFILHGMPLKMLQ